MAGKAHLGLVLAALALGGCWQAAVRTPPPELVGHFADAAVVARPAPGYTLWLKRDFLFTPGGAEGVVDFFADPEGRTPTLGARVAATYELSAPTAPGDYPARVRFTRLELIPRAPYMVTLLGSGPCGAGGWALERPGDVLATNGCQPLGFTVPAYDRIRVQGATLRFGEEPPLQRLP
jgi:hypothetical protein